MTALYLAVIFFVALDRWLKVLAIQGARFNLLGEIFKFEFAKNFYIAFSLPLYGAWLNAVILIIILSLIYYIIRSWRAGSRGAALCLFAVVLGASSNLFDRLKYGYVVDYLDLKYFTVFNLADIMIVAGITGLLVSLRIKEKKYEQIA